MNQHVARRASLAIVALCMVASASAQVAMQPTPRPWATAENEPWYVNGEPISFGGGIYYPSGPISHFIDNEMVLSGTFGRTPIYTRTTREPGSMVYVPLPGGLVRPYERRRAGELAGTVGSTTPRYPVVLPAEEARGVAGGPTPATPEDAAVGTSGFAGRGAPVSGASAAPASGASTASLQPVGTAGRVVMPPTPLRTRVQSVRRPAGLNAVFVVFGGARYFAAGPAVELASTQFTRSGEYNGYPVYRARNDPDTIYIPLVSGSPALLTPYTREGTEPGR